jgi:hypothetical protein
VTRPDFTFVPASPQLFSNFRERRTVRQTLYQVKVWLFWRAMRLKGILWSKK